MCDLDVSNRRSTAVTKLNKNRSKSNIAYVQVVDSVLFNMNIQLALQLTNTEACRADTIISREYLQLHVMTSDFGPFIQAVSLLE